MKFSTSQQSLAEALRVVTAATSKKSTMPITECVLLTASSGGCRVEANDLEVHASAEFDAEVAKPGRTVLPAKKFAPYIYATDKAATVSFQDGDNWRVKVKAGPSQATIAGMDPASFADAPAPGDHAKRFTISGERLAKMIEWVSMTIPPDLGIGSSLTCGALMQVTDGEFSILSNGSVSCSCDTEPAPDAPDFAVTVPRKALQIVAHCGDGEVEIAAMESQVSFAFGRVKITTRLLGKYRDWRATTGKYKRTGSVTVPISSLRASIERAAMFTEGPGAGLVLSVDGDEFCIGTTNAESSVDERIEATIDGIPLPRVGFGAAYLLAPLAKLSTDTVTIRYGNPLKETVEICDGNAQYHAMARRLAEGE